jgi:hypothetical protein
VSSDVSFGAIEKLGRSFGVKIDMPSEVLIGLIQKGWQAISLEEIKTLL